jgi:hypothetical protein
MLNTQKILPQWPAFDGERELMHDMLVGYGRRWLEVVLPAWETAYRSARGRLLKALGNGAGDPPPGIVGAVVAPMHAFASLAFIPMAAGLKRLASIEPACLPSAEELAEDRSLEFGRMLASCAQALLNLRQKARSVSEDEFERFLSRSLLSPIWYPPREPDPEQLAKRVELRLWARAAEAIVDDPDDEADLGGMAGRLEELGAVDSGGYVHRREAAVRSMGEAAIALLNTDYIHNRLAPWIPKELARPDPFDYPVPDHVQAYLDVLGRLSGANEACRRWLFASRRPPAEVVMQQVPYVHLDWSDVADGV